MTIEVTQSDREMAAKIAVISELRELILAGDHDDCIYVQTIARARIAGWNAAVETVEGGLARQWATVTDAEDDYEDGYETASGDAVTFIRTLHIEEANHDHP